MASQDWFDKDFYAILGVSKDISEADLKKTYRKLARQYHPDSNPGDAKAEAKFKEISEDGVRLADPETRKEYDQVRAMGSGARFTSGGGGQPGGFEDVFGGMFGGGRPQQRAGFQQNGFEDILGGMFGGGGFGQPTGGFRGAGGPIKGRDLVANTVLDFITAIHGDTITLQPAGGKPIKVKIPAGVSDGQKIRLKGKGEASIDGGESGDLVITVTVRKHPVFERDGLNLRFDEGDGNVDAASTFPSPSSKRRSAPPSRYPPSVGNPCGCVLRPVRRVAAFYGSRAAGCPHRRVRATCSPRFRWLYPATCPRVLAKRSRHSPRRCPMRTRAPI
jgi:molecular chaperone DnaJ